MPSIDWGDIPTWVTAIPTAAAFVVAARSYRMSVRDRHTAQARRVYMTVDKTVSFSEGEHVPTTDFLLGGSSIATARLDRLVPAKDNRGNMIFVAAANIVVLTVTLHNRSDEPINRWLVQFEKSDGTTYPTDGPAFGATTPEGSTSFTTVIAHDLPPKSSPSLTPVVFFEDSANTWWCRRLNESVKEVAKRNVPTTNAHRS